MRNVLMIKPENLHKTKLEDKLLPTILLRHTKITKGAKTYWYLLPRTGEIWKTAPKENEISENLTPYTTTVIASSFPDARTAYLYVKYIENVGGTGKKGLLFRVAMMKIGKVDKTVNEDIREWEEWKHPKAFPFIATEDGQVFDEDGTTPKFTEYKGKFYNKRVVELLYYLYTDYRIRESQPSTKQVEKFFIETGLRKASSKSSYWGMWAWSFAKDFKNFIPRNINEETKKMIEEVNSSSWDIGKITTTDIDYLFSKMPNKYLKQCWVIDPKENTDDQTILHRITFDHGPRTPKETARMIFPKKGNPYVFAKQYGLNTFVKTAIDRINMDKLYLLPDQTGEREKNQTIQLASDFNVILAYKASKNSLYKKLLGEGNDYYLNMLNYILDNTSQEFKIDAHIEGNAIKLEHLGSISNRKFINKYLKGVDKNDMIITSKAYCALLYYLGTEAKIDNTIIENGLPLFVSIIKRGIHYVSEFRFNTKYYWYRSAMDKVDETEKNFYSDIINAVKGFKDLTESQKEYTSKIIYDCISAIRTKTASYSVKIPRFSTWKEFTDILAKSSII